MINSRLITKANFCSSFEPYLRLSLPKLINLHELSYFPTNSLIASLCLLSLVSENSAVKKPKSSHAKGINRVPFLAGACGRRNGIYFRRFLSGTVWIALALVSVNYNDVAGCHLSSQKLHTSRLFHLCLNYELRTCVCVCLPAKFIIAILHATRTSSRKQNTEHN